MILRATTGRSFKGVGKYVLHDKGAQTADRVSFIETDNLMFSDGNRAVAEMVHTATNQREIKRRAGGRATATSKPVYHLSLSWDTSESPSLKDQMEAARAAIAALGLSNRQAMIVGHTDTDNPHVHAVINLVCPITGNTAKIGNDRLKLSQWAEQYRKERGQEHLCPQRKANNDRRRDGERVKADNMTRQEYEAWKKSQTKDIWDSFRADRAKARDSRKAQFDALWRQKEERIAQRREEIKAVFKPQWRDLFKRQSTDLKNFDAGFFDRLGFAFSRKNRSKLGGLLQAITGDGNLRVEFIRKQELERKLLGDQHKARVADAARETRKAWQFDRDQLKASHEAQDHQAHVEAKAKSTEVWRQPAPEQSKPDFEKSSDRRDPAKTPKRRSFEAFFGGDEKAISKAREAQKKQRDTNRTRNRQRKRDRDGGREFDR